MKIGFTTGLSSITKVQGDTGPLPSTLGLTELSRDAVVFDTGAAFGLDAATVPVQGTADPGGVIQARALDAGTGTALTAWDDIATTDAQGNWSGVLSGLSSALPLCRAEVRLKANPQVTATMNNRFAPGHVVAIWGQSEWHRSVLSGFANLSAVETVTDPAALSIAFVNGTGTQYGDSANYQYHTISDATPVSAAMTAFSNALSAMFPGQKFLVVFQTLSATGMHALLDDTETARNWADDVAFHNWACAQGNPPGLALSSWYNSDATYYGNGIGDLYLKAIGGIDPATGGPAPLAGPNEHLFSELYDFTRTKWSVFGPHRFDVDGYDTLMPSVRSGLETLFDSPYLPAHMERGLEPLTYLNGNASGGDSSHPNTGSNAADGMHQLMRLTAAEIGRALGQTPWDTPEFDNAVLAGDSTYVEVWSSAGAITTTRAKRLENVPGGYPAVYGFYWDGVLANEVEIIGGRARVYLNAAHDPIPDGSMLTFAHDSVGIGLRPDDLTLNAVWKDHPIVDVGFATLEGIPIRANTPQSVLGVVPSSGIPADPNSNPNLFDPDISAFTITDAKGGWNTPANTSFAFNGDGTLDIQPIDNDSATADTLNNVGLRGLDLELSFVMTSSAAASGDFRLVANAVSGGNTALGTFDLPISLNQRHTITLPTFPTNRQALRIVIRRRLGSTGVLRLSQLTLKEVTGP